VAGSQPALQFLPTERGLKRQSDDFPLQMTLAIKRGAALAALAEVAFDPRQVLWLQLASRIPGHQHLCGQMRILAEGEDVSHSHLTPNR
jgi:hypothetical protein